MEEEEEPASADEIESLYKVLIWRLFVMIEVEGNKPIRKLPSMN